MQRELLEKQFHELQTQLIQKMVTLQEASEQAIYKMYDAFIKECQSQLIQLEEMKKETLTKGIISNYEEEFYELIEEVVTQLNALLEVPCAVMIRKKSYCEAMDDLIADLDDWIENVNEALDGKGTGFNYMEAWDIGVFFES